MKPDISKIVEIIEKAFDKYNPHDGQRYEAEEIADLVLKVIRENIPAERDTWINPYEHGKVIGWNSYRQSLLQALL